MNTQLTPKEREVLTLLIEESRANGHDFGVVECIKWDGRSLGGLLTSLQTKGVIVEIDSTIVNDNEKVTQYVLHDSFKI